MRIEEGKREALPLTRVQEELLKRIQSSKPTRYRLRTEPYGEVHVFCANDALLYTLLTAQPVELEAKPPIGQPFTLRLAPEGPERFNLWQSFVDDTQALPKVQGVPSKSCPYHHLFERQDDAERWHAGLASSLADVVQVLPLQDVWQRAQARIEALASHEGETARSCCS
jgi:hypothetical protein